MRKRTQLRNSIFLITSVILFCLTICASAGTIVNHSFSFDAAIDSPNTEVLDYQYGSSKQFGTHADKERMALGQIFPADNIYGAMPRGEFLYVKWRVKGSEKEFEDKVDLTSRLPANIEGLRIHFVIRGSQLYVYLIWPFDGHQYPPGDLKRYMGQKREQVYPDQPR